MTRHYQIDLDINLQKEPVTLTFYTNYLPYDYKQVLAEIEARTRETLNIRLELKSIDGQDKEGHYVLENLNELTEDVIKSGKPCDAFFATYNVNEAKDLSAYFLDITELFPRYAPKLYSSFDPVDLEYIKKDGRIYYIPEKNSSSRRPCVVVRKDLADLYGISDIKNLDDYINFMELVKNKPNIAPSVFNPLFWSTSDFIEAHGYVSLPGYMVYKRDDSEMKVIPWEQTDAFRHVINAYKKMEEKGFIKLSQGRSPASFIGNLGMLKNKDFVSAIFDKAEEYYIYPLYPDVVYSRSPGVLQYGILIPKNSQHPERVLEFLDWVYSSQENYDLLMYGIEGRHYKLVGSKVEPVRSLYGSNQVYRGFYDFFSIDYRRPMVYDPENFQDIYKEIENLNIEVPPHETYKFDYNAAFRDLEDEFEKREQAFANMQWTFDDDGNLYYKGFLDDGLCNAFIEQQRENANQLAARLQKILDEARKRE